MRKNAKVKIKGVTGIRHMPFLDRMDGRRDGRTNQVRDVGDGVSTPRVVQKCRSCDRYTNGLYLSAAASLEALYKDIAVSAEELERMEACPDEGDAGRTVPVFREEALRQAAARKSMKEARERRIRELQIRLAGLGQECRNIDESLHHSVDRARAVLRAHVEAYWSGVLRGAADGRLPVSPVMTDEELSGEPVYAGHRKRIEELLESVPEGRGKESE